MTSTRSLSSNTESVDSLVGLFYLFIFVSMFALSFNFPDFVCFDRPDWYNRTYCNSNEPTVCVLSNLQIFWLVAGCVIVLECTKKGSPCKRGQISALYFAAVVLCFSKMFQNTVNCSYTGLVGLGLRFRVRHISNPVYPNTTLYKTYCDCELFLRDWNSRSGMCEFRYNRVRYKSNWLYLLVFCLQYGNLAFWDVEKILSFGK